MLVAVLRKDFLALAFLQLLLVPGRYLWHLPLSWLGWLLTFADLEAVIRLHRPRHSSTCIFLCRRDVGCLRSEANTGFGGLLDWG
jgi:hypothetical protein